MRSAGTHIPLLAAALTLLQCGIATLAPAQQGHLEWVKRAATAGDEVVLGAEKDRIVMLVHPGQAPENWEGAETRIAKLGKAPWKVQMPEVWGHVPSRRQAWADVGEIVHLDIDPEENMAVLTAVTEGKTRIWMSARKGPDDQHWREPWPISALADFSGSCAFAVFDVHAGRAGDLLVALRPQMKGGAETLVPDAGYWKGGYDMARIPRKGGYASVLLLDEINSAADEMALVPGPDGGGWLSTERMKGAGGLDPWWCGTVPLGGIDSERSPQRTLVGHTLEVLSNGAALHGLSWQVSREGAAVNVLRSGADGRASLETLKADQRYDFRLVGDPPVSLGGAVALWRDAGGRVVRRFKLTGSQWSLSFLTLLPLGGWREARTDLSRLPRTPIPPKETTRNEPDWVVFHALGDMSLSAVDQTQLRALARKLKSRPNDVVHIIGHASPDGNPNTNVRLAAERARHVAAQLEFAGLNAHQIRFEGMGDQMPMRECPPGIQCPEGALERSRRTELHIGIGGRTDGAAMQ